VTSFGHSAGGYGALHFGVDRQAERILALSCVTNVSPEFAAESGDPRAKVVARRIGRSAPKTLQSFKHRFNGEQSIPPIDLVYSQGSMYDRIHAEHLGDAPGVTLHPIQGVERHSLFTYLHARGALEGHLFAS